MLKGFQGLLSSKKATMCLLILTASTVSVLLSKIDGTSYAAIMTVISTIYSYTAYKTDVAFKPSVAFNPNKE